MKILSIVLLSLVALGANAEWRVPYGRGFGNERGRGPPWAYPQQQQNQINSNSEEIEWVCQNPKTNDIMIIASDNTQQQQPQQPQHPGGPWWQWQTLPSGHQNQHHHHHHHQQQGGNYWTIHAEEPTREGTHGNQLPTTTEIPNNNNHQLETTPHHHGGEGLIDIRIAE